MQSVDQMWMRRFGEKVFQGDVDGYGAFRCMFSKEAGVGLALCVPVGFEVRHQPCEINVGGRGGAIQGPKKAANCAWVLAPAVGTGGLLDED